MADELNVVPIWCDVGKNLNAVSLVVSLGRFTKGKLTCGGKSKQIVRISPRKLICETVDINKERDLKNAVDYPGENFWCLLHFKSFEA